MNKTAITAIVTLIIGAGAGFYGGTIYEKNKLSSQGLLRSESRNGFGQNGPQGRNGGGPGGRNNGNFATGQIISKDDKSITVKTPDGGSKIVFFTGSTSVGKTVSGSISDLSNGQEVMANGTANPDGSLSAQNIQIRPDHPSQQP